MPKNHRRIGPYSRRLNRGVIAQLFDGRSAEGRFVRALEAQLIAHLGGAPSIVQKLLIERLIRLRIQIDGLDAKLAAGNWTAHDGRTYGGMLNAFRLTCRELGLKPAAARPISPAELLARRVAAREGQE